MIWLVRHAICALLPSSDHFPGPAELGIDAFLVQLRRESNGLFWFGVVAGGVVFAVSPLITVGLPVPSFFLSAAALDRHASRIASHRFYLVRQSMVLLKMVAGFCWGAHPRVREKLALAPYPPDPGTWRAS